MIKKAALMKINNYYCFVRTFCATEAVFFFISLFHERGSSKIRGGGRKKLKIKIVFFILNVNKYILYSHQFMLYVFHFKLLPSAHLLIRTHSFDMFEAAICMFERIVKCAFFHRINPDLQQIFRNLGISDQRK